MSKSSNNSDIDTTVASDTDLPKKRKTLCEQDKKTLNAKKKKFMKEVECAENILKKLTSDPNKKQLWNKPVFKVVRQEIAVIASHPEIYQPLPGDTLPDNSMAVEIERKRPSLTSNFISDIAKFKEVSEGLDASPVMQVVALPSMNLEESSRSNKSSHIHFTHLRIRDGSNNVMLGRLSMHLAHDGNKLGEGDIIRLISFTPLRFTPRVQDGSPHRLPAVVIHTYTKIDYAPVPKRLNPPLHCGDMTKEEIEQYNIDSIQFGGGVAAEDQYEKLGDKPECTAKNRCCSRYGVSMVLCVCESDPVDKVDLDVVRQYCYFATKPVDKMDNGNIRNMLYWWYMTNTYHICGKGRRVPVPSCLLYAIRTAYPSENELYKKYVPGSR